MVVTVTGFVALGWWQLRRAEGGNLLSWAYTFEWPLFAGFVVVFWLRVMRDELRDAEVAGREQERGEAAAGGAPVTLPARHRTGQGTGGRDAGERDGDLAARDAYLSRLGAEASRSTGWLAGRGSRRVAAWAARPGRAAGPGKDGTAAP